MLLTLFPPLVSCSVGSWAVILIMWLGLGEISFPSKGTGEVEKAFLSFILIRLFWRIPNHMECFFPIQESVYIWICKFNPPFCLTNGFYLLCPWNKRNTVTLAEAHLTNQCWNWRELCCGGNKRAQPALVPGPDKGWLRVRTIYRSVLCAHFLLALHSSDGCPWLYTGLGLPVELI